MINQMRSESVDSYTSLQSLQDIKNTGRDSKPEALRKVAEQFESMFINMMMKGMRDGSKVFAKDNYFSSFETEFHQEMLDNQLSVDLSKGSGIGLADVMMQQMQRQYGMDRGKQATNTTDGAIEPRVFQQSPQYQQVVTQRTEKAPATVAVKPAEKFEKPQEFVQAMIPAVEQGARELGLEPKALMAQAALESGWGKHMMRDADGRPSYNVFGIKADKNWEGDTVSVQTLEYRDGVARQERAQFRAYDSLEHSVQDYVAFLNDKSRYQQALATTNDAPAYWRELQQAGYATDPAYAEKIQAVYNGETLNKALKESQQMTTLARTETIDG